MTEAQTDKTEAGANPEDIVNGDDAPSARLERDADTILDEGRAFGPRPLRRALREDARSARDWGRRRVSRLRATVEDEPMKATVLALGAGVLIGLLAAR